MLDLGSLVEISIILDIVNHKKTHWIKKKLRITTPIVCNKQNRESSFLLLFSHLSAFMSLTRKFRDKLTRHLANLEEVTSRSIFLLWRKWEATTRNRRANSEMEAQTLSFKEAWISDRVWRLEKRAEFPSWSGWRLCRVHKKWFVLGSTPSSKWKKLYPRSQSLGLLINLLKRLHLFNDGKKYNTFIRYPFIICCWHNSLCAIALINQLIKQTFNKPTIKLTTKYII